MLDLQLKYNPVVNPDSLYTPDATQDVMSTASALASGHIPKNLVSTSMASSNYRDGVINVLLTQLNNESAQQRIIKNLATMMSSTEDVIALNTYAEYVAVLGYAWKESVVATRAIIRVKPELASSFLKKMATTIANKTSVDKFTRDIVNDTASSQRLYDTLERASLFPL